MLEQYNIAWTNERKATVVVVVVVVVVEKCNYSYFFSISSQSLTSVGPQ